MSSVTDITGLLEFRLAELVQSLCSSLSARRGASAPRLGRHNLEQGRPDSFVGVRPILWRVSGYEAVATRAKVWALTSSEFGVKLVVRANPSGNRAGETEIR